MLTSGPDPREVYEALWRVVVAGIIVSGVFLTVGLILLPLQAPPGRASMAPVLITLREAALFRGVAWCELGILALIATPMAVVLIAIATYARARQWAYVGAGVVVLAVWIASQVWS